MTEPASTAPRTSTTVTIDALELEGFPSARRFAIAAAFQRALGRLIEERGPPRGLMAAGGAAGPGGRAEPTAPVLRLDPDGPPAVAGERIAQAVYEALG